MKLKLPMPRLLAVVFLALSGWVIGALWVGSFLYLWKIGQPRSMASPFLLFQYWSHYGHMAGVTKTISLCAAAGGLILLIPFGALLVPQKRKLYGDAKLATLKDLKDAKMLEAGKTFFLMSFKGRYVFGPLTKIISVILAAPPRSGKGVSQVQPNMLYLDTSVIITDIRQESYQLTSGFRSTFSEVYLINPFPTKARDKDGKVKFDPDTGEEIWEARTSQWNPFFYVPEEIGLRINQIQKIANFLFPDPADGKDNFWASSSRSLFLGLSLYIFETDGLPKTIGEVLRQAQSGGENGDSISEYWAGVIKNRETSVNPLSSFCVDAIRDFISTGGNTLTSIRKSLTSTLDLWQNPIVDAMTSGNSFDLRELRCKKMTIYLGVTPDNLERATPFLSLFLQQAMDLNMQEMPAENPRIKHPLALILDEITALGRLEVLAKRIGYMNGYWIMPYFIIQSFAQLRGVYGKEAASAMLDCIQIKMAFAPKSLEDAKLLSEEIGYITEENHSVSTGRGLLNDNNGSTSKSSAQRALFLPQEVKELGDDAIIMIAEGLRPALGEKVRYFNTPVFKKRLMPPFTAPLLDYQTFLAERQKANIAAAVMESDVPVEPGSEFFNITVGEPDFNPVSAEFDDIFNTSPSPEINQELTDQATPFENIFSVVEEPPAQDDPDFVGVFAPLIQKSTLEKENLLVPNQISDYQVSLEEILGLNMEGVEVSPELLPAFEKLELDELMQDFSNAVIPQTSVISDDEMDRMLSGFFGVLPTYDNRQAA